MASCWIYFYQVLFQVNFYDNLKKYLSDFTTNAEDSIVTIVNKSGKINIIVICPAFFSFFLESLISLPFINLQSSTQYVLS